LIERLDSDDRVEFIRQPFTITPTIHRSPCVSSTTSWCFIPSPPRQRVYWRMVASEVPNRGDRDLPSDIVHRHEPSPPR
jgi:hypothetical protein